VHDCHYQPKTLQSRQLLELYMQLQQPRPLSFCYNGPAMKSFLPRARAILAAAAPRKATAQPIVSYLQGCFIGFVPGAILLALLLVSTLCFSRPPHEYLAAGLDRRPQEKHMWCAQTR